MDKPRKKSSGSQRLHWPATRKGFTLIELLVVISIIALLIGILLPSLAAARETARQIQCASQIRQLALAAEIYANDHDGHYPARGAHWPQALHRNYQTVELLNCPTDDPPFRNPNNPPTNPEKNPDTAKRSYLINGWNDVYSDAQGGGNQTTAGGWSMDRSAIRNTSQVILFGEKKTDSNHYYMDMFEGSAGNQYAEVEHVRHGGSKSTSVGGASNYAFADGSTRTYQFPNAMSPTNLWAVIPAQRKNTVPPATP